MHCFLFETGGKKIPEYWFFEVIDSNEAIVNVNIYQCFSTAWAQKQPQDMLLTICNPDRGDKIWDFPGQEPIEYEYWLTIYVVAEHNYYSIKSSYTEYNEEHDEDFTLDSYFQLYSTDLITLLPILIKKAVYLAGVKSGFFIDNIDLYN